MKWIQQVGKLPRQEGEQEKEHIFKSARMGQSSDISYYDGLLGTWDATSSKFQDIDHVHRWYEHQLESGQWAESCFLCGQTVHRDKCQWCGTLNAPGANCTCNQDLRYL